MSRNSGRMFPCGEIGEKQRKEWKQHKPKHRDLTPLWEHPIAQEDTMRVAARGEEIRYETVKGGCEQSRKCLTL